MAKCLSVFVFFNIQEINQRKQEGQLDEGFLAGVNAQLRQVSLFELMPSSLFWFEFTLGLCVLALSFSSMHILLFVHSLSLSLSSGRKITIDMTNLLLKLKIITWTPEFTLFHVCKLLKRAICQGS